MGACSCRTREYTAEPSIMPVALFGITNDALNLVVNLLILCVIGKLKQFALVYVMTRGGPLWATETVATYVVKRAFNWRTFDLGYPSAIAVIGLRTKSGRNRSETADSGYPTGVR